MSDPAPHLGRLWISCPTGEGAAEGAESWLRKSLCVKAAGGAGSRYKAPPLPPPRSHSSGTRSTPVVAFTHKNPQPDAPGTYHSQTHRGRTTARRTGDAARRGPEADHHADCSPPQKQTTTPTSPVLRTAVLGLLEETLS
ncbi:unnamed protein product [Arctogadus glacialis]